MGEIIATGSRGQVAFGEETAYGTLVPPTKRIDFTSESIQANVGDLVSQALNPSRGTTKRTLGNVDVGGDINFEQNTEGYTTLYKHTLGNRVTIDGCDGGIRTYVTADTLANSLTLGCETMLESDGVTNKFPATGIISVAYLDANYELQQFPVVYISRDEIGFTFGAPIGTDVHQGAFVFLYDAAYLIVVYTHAI